MPSRANDVAVPERKVPQLQLILREIEDLKSRVATLEQKREEA